MIDFSDKKDCCGCTACASICYHNAISMVSDAMGFMYPLVNKGLCVNCGLCDKVCQFHKDYNRYNNFAVPQVYGCRHKEITELMKSQSGAASWAIIQSFLQEPCVIYGVGYESVAHIVHKRATTLDKCGEFRGSKYVQSDIRGIFEQVKNDLSNGKRVLFFGTGCQVSGLNSFIPARLHQDLYTTDIVCHSTPSPAVWKSYIEYLQRTNKKTVTQADFRKKSLGWNSHNQSFVFDDGTTICNTIFFDLYYKHLIIRPSCTNCYFTNLNRVSDVTIGDFWGWEKYHKEWNDNKGVSLFLVNSAKGEQIREQTERYLDFIKSNTSECLQPQLQYPIESHPDSDKIVKLFAQKGFEGIARKYGLIPGYKYYKDRIMPYFNSGKQKVARLLGLYK